MIPLGCKEKQTSARCSGWDVQTDPTAGTHPSVLVKSALLLCSYWFMIITFSYFLFHVCTKRFLVIVPSSTLIEYTTFVLLSTHFFSFLMSQKTGQQRQFHQSNDQRHHLISFLLFLYFTKNDRLDDTKKIKINFKSFITKKFYVHTITHQGQKTT